MSCKVGCTSAFIQHSSHTGTEFGIALPAWGASTWPKNNIMEVCDSTPDLARHIARTAGMVPAVARLRRSALKEDH